MRISRWASRLMVYSFSVEHVRGDSNPADALSRLPSPVAEAADDESVTVAAVAGHLQAVTREELVTASRSDPQLQQLAEQIPRPWPRRYRDCPEELKPFYRCKEELGVADDVLIRGERPLVPASLRPRLLAAAHEGHQGMVRTKQRIRQHFWWPGLDTAVEELVRNCEVCASSDRRRLREKLRFIRYHYPTDRGRRSGSTSSGRWRAEGSGSGSPLSSSTIFLSGPRSPSVRVHRRRR